jgi:fumarate hydratase class II
MRIEHDTMGAVEIPDGALWGAQTQRAAETVPISGLRFGRRLIHALGHVKRACARANVDLGHLEDGLGRAVVQACDELIAGQWDDQFPIDVFQTDSGTSTTMNANEVIANRAIQLLDRGRKAEVGSKTPVHPNDHVRSAVFHRMAGERGACLHGSLRGRDRGERRALPPDSGAQSGAGYDPGARYRP